MHVVHIFKLLTKTKIFLMMNAKTEISSANLPLNPYIATLKHNNMALIQWRLAFSRA